MRDDWDQTLVRFQTELGHTLYNSRNGQLSGGLEPVMALAEINKIVKDDLKQSVSCFSYGVLVIILLICQPGNSHSGIRRPERESAPGMWKTISKAY